MGALASEMLARALAEYPADDERTPLEWVRKDLGQPRIDLEDRDAVQRVMDADE